MELTFTFTLTSDYHIGAGHGLGARADSALLRDRDQLPVLRGSTVEGLLRDGLWRLLQTAPETAPIGNPPRCRASGLKGEEHPAYCITEHCPICAVFGTPEKQKRWRFSSARPADNQTPLDPKQGWQTGQTGAQIAARVRISPRQRRADAGKLFKQEEGDGRLCFTFSASCPVKQDETHETETHEQAALLVAAARMVRRLGSARRRGRGECLLKLEAVKDWHATMPADGAWQAHLLTLFQQRWLESRATVLTFAPAVWAKPVAAASTERRFQLLIRADEPIVVARRAEAGNIYDGVEAISGATVLGALAAEAAARRDVSGSDIYDDFLDVFRRGQVRFAPLYPAYVDQHTGELYPAIPAPLDLLVCKLNRDLSGEHNKLKSWARETQSPEDCPACLALSNGQCPIPLVPINQFVAVRHGAQAVVPCQREEMHPRIDPHTQRVATGDLFGYVALESGQYFVGELWCQNEEAWQTLCALTEVVREQEAFRFRLGKATARGYGLVTAWLEPIADENFDQWRGQPLEQRVTNVHEPVALTLLTDAILPDVWGRFRQRLDLAWLQELVGPQVIKQRNVFCKSVYVDNFNNYLGLPRWRDIAIKAGSVIGFEVDPATNLTALQPALKKREKEGIGVRRHEGFGQIVFNHPIYKDGIGVTGTRIQVHKDLQLKFETAGAAKILHNETVALKEWAEALSKDEYFDPKLYKEPQWDAVARWLHAAANRPVSELLEQLDQIADPVCWTRKDQKRELKEFRTEERTKNALGQLKNLLNAQADEPDELRRKKIQLVADALAAIEKKGEK